MRLPLFLIVSGLVFVSVCLSVALFVCLWVCLCISVCRVSPLYIGGLHCLDITLVFLPLQQVFDLIDRLDIKRTHEMICLLQARVLLTAMLVASLLSRRCTQSLGSRKHSPQRSPETLQLHASCQARRNLPVSGRKTVELVTHSGRNMGSHRCGSLRERGRGRHPSRRCRIKRHAG